MYEKMKVKMNMRKLFTDHTIWTRQFIVDLLGDLPSIDYTTDRLLKNQEAIGNYSKDFYGDIAGENIGNLFKEHIILTANLLKAIKTQDNSNAELIETDAVNNVEDISKFFGTINPCYSIEDLIDLFKTHLVLVKYQFIARMNRDYNADIMYYDIGLHHLLVISDYISQGIIERFFEEIMLSSQNIQEQTIIQEQTNQFINQNINQSGE